MAMMATTIVRQPERERRHTLDWRVLAQKRLAAANSILAFILFATSRTDDTVIQAVGFRIAVSAAEPIKPFSLVLFFRVLLTSKLSFLVVIRVTRRRGDAAEPAQTGLWACIRSR